MPLYDPRIRRPAAIAMFLAAALACAPRSPADRAAVEASRLQREAAELYVRRGREAERTKDYAAAAEWWRQAALLDPEGSAERRIRRAAAEIERFGDVSVGAKKFEDAFLCYGALLQVEPDLPQIIKKNDAAHASFGEERHRAAAALEKEELLGAAFATELQALRHAPLHPEAFSSAARLKLELLTRNHVAVQGIEMHDRGFWGLGEALVPRLDERLREEAPLGPTRARPWIAGRVRVEIERFEWWDETRFGIERKKMDPEALALVEMPEAEAEEGGIAGAARDLVANPEHDARAFLVGETELEVERLQAILRLADAPRPEPPKKIKQKSQLAATPVRTPVPPRPPTAEQVENLQADLEDRRDSVGRVATNLDRSKAKARWILPWRETTRTVEARVRFELHEFSAPEPDVILRTLRVTEADRTHPGSALHGVDPDRFEIAALDVLEARLADAFVNEVDVLGQARARRAARVIARGRRALEAGDVETALDAFVDALFLVGPDKLPDDAAAVIAFRLEHDRFRSILAGPP